MASEGFSLPGSGYDELTKILQAYRAAGDESSLDEVAGYAAVNRTTVSRNNKFLFEIEFLGGTTQNRRLTESGRRLAQALEHDVTEEISKSWRELVGDDPFMNKVVSAVRIRGGMNEDDLFSHIAFTSGRPKNSATTTGARTVATILEEAGLLESRDGEYHAATPSTEVGDAAPPSERSETGQRVGSQPSTQADSGRGLWRSLLELPTEPTPASPSGQGPLSIRLEIRVDAKPEDLPELGERIREMMSGLAEGPAPDESQDD